MDLQGGYPGLGLVAELRSVTLAAMGVATAVFGFSLTGYVTRPLAYASGKLHEVSQGKYFDWVEVGKRDDEIGRMLQTIKMTQFAAPYLTHPLSCAIAVNRFTTSVME